MSENAEKNVCTRCLGDAGFSQWIADNGEPGQCDYDKSHGAKNPVVTLHDLASHTDEYFRANYCHGGEYVYFAGESDRPNYETYGESYKHIYKSSLFRQSGSTRSNIALFSKETDFVGADNSVVEYVSHEIRRIDDVTYTTSNQDWI